MTPSTQPQPHQIQPPMIEVIPARQPPQPPPPNYARPEKPPRRPYVWDIDADDAVHHRRPRALSRTRQRPNPRFLPSRYRAVPDEDQNDRVSRQAWNTERARLEQDMPRYRDRVRARDRAPEREYIRHRNLIEDEDWDGDYARDYEEWYEDEIVEKLRRLDRLERRTPRMQEERRVMEEKARREASDKEQKEADAEKERARILQEEQMRSLQRKAEEEEVRERIRREIKFEEALRVVKEQEGREKEEKIRRAAVEEYKLFLGEQRSMDEVRLRKQIEKEIWDEIEAQLGETLEQAKEVLRQARAEKQEEEEARREMDVKDPVVSVVQDDSAGLSEDSK